MVSHVERLVKAGVANPPSWIRSNTVLEFLTGSVSYGVSDDTSDMDVVAIAIPPKSDMLRPHMIHGFDPLPKPFGTWQKHHMRYNTKMYDLTVYGLPEFLKLTMGCNPNLLACLFTPRRCILTSSEVGEMLVSNRKLFLSKLVFPKYRGYAMSQMQKIETKTGSDNPKRQATIEAHGFDTKYAMHLVRLLLECEQILSTGDVDITRDRELLKGIRRGEWSLEQVKQFFVDKDRSLEEMRNTSNLPETPPVDQVRNLLLNCLEHHYGSLDVAKVGDDGLVKFKGELQSIMDRY